MFSKTSFVVDATSFSIVVKIDSSVCVSVSLDVLTEVCSESSLFAADAGTKEGKKYPTPIINENNITTDMNPHDFFGATVFCIEI